MTRILLIHQNFPGQFRHLAQHLAQRPDVELMTLGRDTAPGLPGVPMRRYSLHRDPLPKQHLYLRQMETAVLHGQAVARELRKMKSRGFVPDVILAHPGWGETLYAKDIFPDTKLVHFCEWFYGTDGADVDFDPEFPTGIDARLRARTWNALHTLNLENCDVGISPTQWQKSRHPLAYQSKIQVIHEGVDTDLLVPDPHAVMKLADGTVLRAGEPIVTYVARNLEPYRGFHIFMRALEKLQRLHSTCHAVIVGGDDVSYGHRPKGAANWREKMLAEVTLDAARTHFTGRLPYDSYRKLLQVSAAHVYLTYPFVLSWSMLEAMASGCLLVASDTAPVREFVRDGETAMLVKFLDSGGVAHTTLEAILIPPNQGQKLRAASRQIAQTSSRVEQGLAGYLRLLGMDAASDMVATVAAPVLNLALPSNGHSKNLQPPVHIVLSGERPNESYRDGRLGESKFGWGTAHV